MNSDAWKSVGFALVGGSRVYAASRHLAEVSCRVLVTLLSLTCALGLPAFGQQVDVGYNGLLEFKDETSGSTSDPVNLTPAITRIHESDTLNFVWQGNTHSIVPYDASIQNAGHNDISER